MVFVIKLKKHLDLLYDCISFCSPNDESPYDAKVRFWSVKISRLG